MADDLDQAISDLRKMPQDKQIMVLKNLSPDRKQAIMGRLSAPAGQPKPAVPKAPQQQPQQPQGPGVLDYAGEAVSGVGRALYGAGQYVASLPQLRPGETQGTTGQEMFTPTRQNIGPVGRTMLHLGEDLFTGLAQGKAARDEAKKQGEGLAGQILSTIENYPVIGPATKKIEEAGPGKFVFKPQTLGGMTELGTNLALPKVVEKVIPTPEGLRKSAGKDVSKYLQMDKQAGYEIGRQKIIGNWEKLANDPDVVTLQKKPGLIRQAIDNNLKPIINKGLTDAAATGVTKDFSGLKTIYEDALTGANPSEVAGIKAAWNDVLHSVDAQGRPVPRNLTQMDPLQAYELTQRINSNLVKATGKEKAMLAKIREDVGAGLDDMAPGTQRSRAAESALIRAEKVANEKYQMEVKGQLKAGLKSIWNARWPFAVTFGIFEAMGGHYLFAAGAASLLAYLHEMPLSTTTRAAIKNAVADLFDDPTKAVVYPKQAPGGPKPPQAPTPAPGQGPGPAGPTGTVPPTGPASPAGPAPTQTPALNAPQAALPAPAAQTPMQPPSGPQGAPQPPQLPQAVAPKQLTGQVAPPVPKVAEAPVKTLAESKAAVAKMYPNATEAELSERAIAHFADVRAQAQATRELGSPLAPGWMKRAQELKDQLIKTGKETEMPKGEAVPAKGLPKEPATTPSSYGPAKTDHFIENQGEVPKENLGFNFAPPEDLGTKVRAEATKPQTKPTQAHADKVREAVGSLTDKSEFANHPTERAAAKKNLDELKEAITGGDIKKQKVILKRMTDAERLAVERAKGKAQTPGKSSTDVTATPGDAPDLRTPEAHVLAMDNVFSDIKGLGEIFDKNGDLINSDAIVMGLKQLTSKMGPEESLAKAQEVFKTMQKLKKAQTK